MVGLDQTASVYTPHSTTGDFTVLAKSGLVCRLAYMQQGPNETANDREDVSQRRRLLWEEAYTMPETAQVEVSGERWNVIAGSLGSLRGPGGTVVYRRCEVIRCQ